MAGGRPSKYKSEYCEGIVEYFEAARAKLDKGKRFRFPTLQGFAADLGVHLETLTNWAKAHEEFFDARKRAEAIQHAVLVEGAMSGVFPAAPAIFTMKNLMKWRDKTDIDVGGQAGNPIQTQNMPVSLLNAEDRATLRQIYQRALQAQKAKTE